MIYRALLFSIAALVAGCANEAATEPASISLMQLGAELPDQADDYEPTALEKARASKVLSAIAFERVTGSKADPARLISDR